MQCTSAHHIVVRAVFLFLTYISHIPHYIVLSSGTILRGSDSPRRCGPVSRSVCSPCTLYPLRTPLVSSPCREVSRSDSPRYRYGRGALPVLRRGDLMGVAYLAAERYTSTAPTGKQSEGDLWASSPQRRLTALDSSLGERVNSPLRSTSVGERVNSPLSSTSVGERVNSLSPSGETPPLSSTTEPYYTIDNEGFIEPALPVEVKRRWEEMSEERATRGSGMRWRDEWVGEHRQAEREGRPLPRRSLPTVIVKLHQDTAVVPGQSLNTTTSDPSSYSLLGSAVMDYEGRFAMLYEDPTEKGVLDTGVVCEVTDMKFSQFGVSFTFRGAMRLQVLEVGVSEWGGDLPHPHGLGPSLKAVGEALLDTPVSDELRSSVMKKSMHINEMYDSANRLEAEVTRLVGFEERADRITSYRASLQHEVDSALNAIYTLPNSFDVWEMISFLSMRYSFDTYSKHEAMKLTSTSQRVDLVWTTLHRVSDVLNRERRTLLEGNAIHSADEILSLPADGDVPTAAYMHNIHDRLAPFERESS